ncbi:hypothetical protein MZO42_09540 [Sphingomonas psychrotolerans]|uniref:PepSY domain-containing protein n=1 Tax=Sphingomonas psychrotolerans TaxID=1327635 RepID=A0ABU3N322_9SPHN|nr:hypothetical protein [Sphingomonas psychrotolerans]MDT8758938.1 hypothetical protein [Sphingomonas psychrotolerans]
MADPYAMRMKMLVKPVFCACLAVLSFAGSASAHAQDSNQEAASQRRLHGDLLPVREIERRVVPRMPGAQYLGFDYEPSTGVYTLKFLRNGSVIWVDADGRTGNILRRTGN